MARGLSAAILLPLLVVASVAVLSHGAALISRNSVRVPVDGLSVTIDVETPWVFTAPTPHEGDMLPSQMLALRDLRADWYSVFGLEPIILGTSFPYSDLADIGLSPPSAPTPSDQGVFFFFGSLESLLVPSDVIDDVAKRLGDLPQSHGCFVYGPGSSHAYTAIVCTGVDELGVVYSIYSLSHLVLGVDPQAFWTEHDPAVLSNVTITVNDSGDRIESTPLAPLVEYRGFFINDEDILAEFAHDPTGKNVFTVDIWDRIYQQILRLKGNVVIVGTAAFPDEPSMLLASRRGLTLAQHHITILGTNCFQWPAGMPYSYAKSSETQQYVWNTMVQYQNTRKTIWTVGYRGLNDYPFWIDDPEFVTNQSRGALISEAMQTQVDIVHNNTVGPQDMFTYLWSEMTDLFTGGFLKIPAGVTVVHADRGNGYVDPLSINLTQPGHGLYFHVAVEGGKQLTETVPPSRIFDTIGQYIRRNATKLLIVNTSDIKFVPIGTRAVMDFIWDPTPYISMDPDSAETAYLTEWLTVQYGASLVDTLLPLHKRYFQIPPILAESLDVHTGEGDLAALARTGASTLSHFIKTPGLNASDLPPVSPFPTGTWAEELLALYVDVQAAVASIPADRVGFYNAHLLTQVAVWYHTVAALDNVTTCTEAIIKRNVTLALASATDAVAHLNALLAVERAGENGRWKGMYLHEWLDGFANLRDVLRELLVTIQTSATQTVNIRPWRFGTGKWNSFFNYDIQNSTIAPVNFPFFNDPHNPSWRIDTAVLMTCHGTMGGCYNTVVGGIFVSTTQVQLTTVNPNPSVSIRYELSLNGTKLVPTTSSPLYKGPITVTQNTTISARAFSDATASATPLLPITRSMFGKAL